MALDWALQHSIQGPFGELSRISKTIGTKKYAEYIIVDQHIVVPETAVEEVSEKVVYLPHHYQANDFHYLQIIAEGYRLSLFSQRISV